MNNKDIMREFIKVINDGGLMTKFIMNIFDYNEINDYNYIFRLIDKNDEIIIDIYDNISDTRFNRYIFNFVDNDNIKEYIDDDVFVMRICILDIDDSYDKILKFAYLFKLDYHKMIDYANSFLNVEFVNILRDIIK